jgi:hypothetical protein
MDNQFEERKPLAKEDVQEAQDALTKVDSLFQQKTLSHEQATVQHLIHNIWSLLDMLRKKL